MDKNIIKRYLTERFVNEEATPGISVTAAANKKSGKINKDSVKAIEKEVSQYDKDLKKNKSEVKDNKFNYNSTEEMEYHNDMEIMNGQEMIEYDREPNKTFLDKAKEGIEGSSRMGNKGGKGMGNAEESWGASSDSFGKDFVKRVKTTTKKRDDASDSVMSFGDDVETVPKGSIPKGKHSAIQENEVKPLNEYNPYGSEEETKFNDQQKNVSPEQNKTIIAFLDKYGPEKTAGALIRKELTDYGLDIYEQPMFIHNQIFSLGQKKITSILHNGDYENATQEARAIADQIYDQIAENKNNNKPQIKESMKRLKFKKEFNGVGNALKMIPESYRVDNKEFEMTDGNESYKIRWEGTLTEGKAVVLTAANKNMINEDMQRMKALMGYKSQDTLGGSKKVNRLTENAIFGDILAKTRVLLEGEDIEDVTSPEGEWDDINVPQANDAKKDIEGSTSDDKGTQAPTPPTGEWEDISVPQAADAKKDVEGSVATEAKTNAPAPKEGYWEEINVPQASDAKKDIKEGEEEEIPVNNEDPKDQPGYVHEDDAEEEEEVIDEAIKLMVSESTGKFYIVGATDKPFAVPAKDNAKALKNPKKYISEVFKK